MTEVLRSQLPDVEAPHVSGHTAVSPTVYAVPDTSSHAVQFYEAAPFLLNEVHRYISTGLRLGETAVVIATAAHRLDLEERLATDGLDLLDARARGQYVALDAAETLARFMVDGTPDADRFMEVVGSTIAAATAVRPVRAFGEMVALLAAAGELRRGHPPGAALERASVDVLVLAPLRLSDERPRRRAGRRRGRSDLHRARSGGADRELHRPDRAGRAPAGHRTVAAEGRVARSRDRRAQARRGRPAVAVPNQPEAARQPGPRHAPGRPGGGIAPARRRRRRLRRAAHAGRPGLSALRPPVRALPLAYCWPPGHGLPGWLLEHKVPYLTNDALGDEQAVPELYLQLGVWSALSTPILDAHGEVLGFFELHNKSTGPGSRRPIERSWWRSRTSPPSRSRTPACTAKHRRPFASATSSSRSRPTSCEPPSRPFAPTPS